MVRHKKVLNVGGVIVLILGLAAGGFWLGGSHSPGKAMNDGAPSIASGSGSLSPDAGGLNVSSAGSVSDLGQLGNSIPGGGAASQESSSGSSPVDPSTFAQYDKYKTNTMALFGDIRVGSGATLGINQKAVITYKGWLTNGTLIDQSQTNASGQVVPISFTMGAHQVIAGLEDGIDGMKVGGSRLVIIPPVLGYGAQGHGPIPGGAVLLFEVDLLDVQQ